VLQYNTIHYGGTSLGNLRVALACEPRRLIPLYHTLHIRWAIEITLCQFRYPITPGVGDPGCYKMILNAQPDGCRAAASSGSRQW
jgi:hypothetical protein